MRWCGRLLCRSRRLARGLACRCAFAVALEAETWGSQRQIAGTFSADLADDDCRLVSGKPTDGRSSDAGRTYRKASSLGLSRVNVGNRAAILCSNNLTRRHPRLHRSAFSVAVRCRPRGCVGAAASLAVVGVLLACPCAFAVAPEADTWGSQASNRWYLFRRSCG